MVQVIQESIRTKVIQVFIGLPAAAKLEQVQMVVLGHTWVL
jgi:hypothetical protein